MFGSAVLDVAIGLVFVYLLLAVFCTAITEAISRRMKLRAVILKEGIDRLLGGIPGASQAIYSHPLIATLARKDEKPSYIAPRAFAVALMDFVGQGQPPGMTSHERFRAAVSSAAGGAATGPQGERELKSALFALAGDPKLAAEAATERLAGWFDESMDRVGGWYKRKIQVITFAVALLVTLAANADTFHILSRLWSDPSLRAVVLAQATERAKKPPRLTIEYPDPDSPIPSAPVDTAAGSSANSSGLTQEDFAAIGQITGWSDDLRMLNSWIRRGDLSKDARMQQCLGVLSEPALLPCQVPAKPGEKKQEAASDPCCVWVAKQMDMARQDSALHWTAMGTHPGTLGAWILWLLSHRSAGWLLTAIAVSLGAPFWFEMLNKLIKMRSTGDSPRDKAAAQKPKATTPAAA